MKYYPFPARLRSGYNGICEYGEGRAVHGDDAVDFSGEFVPLLPLGTPAEVDWIFGEGVVATFPGTVYLSSPTLARVVDVPPALARAARETFRQNTRISAAAAPADAPGEPFPVTIIYLSPTAVTLQTARQVEEGSSLVLNAEVDFLTLDGLALQVRQRLALRRGDTLLICDVPPAGDANLIALSAYSARLDHLD